MPVEPRGLRAGNSSGGTVHLTTFAGPSSQVTPSNLVGFPGPVYDPSEFVSGGASEGNNLESGHEKPEERWGESGGVSLADEQDEANDAVNTIEATGMSSGGNAGSPSWLPEQSPQPPPSPRDIFSPQHRIPRAPTPPSSHLMDLLQLLTEEERELILSLQPDTRSNASREEGGNPSIDFILSEQLSAPVPSSHTTPQYGLPQTWLPEDLHTEGSLSEPQNLDIALELDRDSGDWISASFASSNSSLGESIATSPPIENPIGRENSPGHPRPPLLEFLRLPLFPAFITSTGFSRPAQTHFFTADEYYDDGLTEGDEEPLIDIEIDNLDFSRLCRRLYNSHRFDHTTLRLTPLATQIKGMKRPEEVTREDVVTNGGDYQAVPWASLGITRDDFRVLRNQTYKNYRNTKSSTCHKTQSLQDNRRFFRFTRQENTKKSRVVHFQLRNLLSVTSRNDIFYSSEHCRIRRTSMGSRKSEVIIDLSNGIGDGSGASPVRVTTMTARHGVCIAGGFSGEYALKSLHTPLESLPIIGTITMCENGITNHVHAHLGRNSGLPVAVFSSNDNKLRVLDCSRNKFIGEQAFDWAINCSATSPDNRLRVVVGDQKDVVIVDADSGSVLRTLSGHQDYGFACAWSDDGYTIATGNQDKTVRIYDARNFSRSITQIGTTIAGARSLRFSDNGCGRRVLVCPEPADYVSIIDAVTWDGMQNIEFFGEIAGVEFSPTGGELFVANSDMCVGGLMEFERWRDEKLDISGGKEGVMEIEDVSQGFSDEEEEEEERRWKRRKDRGRISLSSIPQQLASSYGHPPLSTYLNYQCPLPTAAPPSQIYIPSPLHSPLIAPNWWDNTEVTLSPLLLSTVGPHYGRRSSSSRRRWGIIGEFVSDEGSDDDEEFEMDTVVDDVGGVVGEDGGEEGVDEKPEMGEEEFYKWKVEKIKEAVQREENWWGGRRKQRYDAELGDIFV